MKHAWILLALVLWICRIAANANDEPAQTENASSASVSRDPLFPLESSFKEQLEVNSLTMRGLVEEGEPCWEQTQRTQWKKDLWATGCADLKYESRRRIAMMLTSCHLEAAGQPSYTCLPEQDVNECNRAMGKDSSAISIMSHFATSVDTMCTFYKMNSEKASTTRAMNAMFTAISDTATQLRAFHQQAGEMGNKLLDTLHSSHDTLQQQMVDIGEKEEARFESLSKFTDEMRQNQEELALQLQERTSALSVSLQDSLALQINMSATQQTSLEQGTELLKSQASLRAGMEGAMERLEEGQDAISKKQASTLYRIQDLQNTTRDASLMASATHKQLTQLQQDQQEAFVKAGESLDNIVAKGKTVEYGLQTLADGVTRIVHLDLTILSELLKVQSFFFYTFSGMVVFLISATDRTKAARFWCFLLLLACFGGERLLASWVEEQGGSIEDYHSGCSFLRQCLVLLSTVIVLGAILTYKNYLHLTHEIARENREMLRYITASPLFARFPGGGNVNGGGEGEGWGVQNNGRFTPNSGTRGSRAGEGVKRNLLDALQPGLENTTEEGNTEGKNSTSSTRQEGGTELEGGGEGQVEGRRKPTVSKSSKKAAAESTVVKKKTPVKRMTKKQKEEAAAAAGEGEREGEAEKGVEEEGEGAITTMKRGSRTPLSSTRRR